MFLNLVFLAVLILPWIGSYFFFGSLGVSTFISFFMIFVSCLLVYDLEKFKIAANVLIRILITGLFIGASIFSSSFLFDFPDFEVYFSAIVFIFCLFIMTHLINLLNYASNIIYLPFLFHLIMGYLKIFGLYNSLINYGSHKSIFPYFEPSHFTLGYAISLAFYWGSSRRTVHFIPILITTIIFSLLLPSAIMLIFSFLLLMIVRNFNIIKFSFLIFLIIAIITAVPALNSYFLDRTGYGEFNLTFLVYMQSLSSISISLVESFAVGVGFQRLGIESPSMYSEIIFDKMNLYMNRNDGGFTAAKIIGEFGLFGLFVVCIYVIYFYRSLLFLKSKSNFFNFSGHNILNFSVAFSFLEIMIRGVGYFSPTFLILISAIYLYGAPSPGNRPLPPKG